MINLRIILARLSNSSMNRHFMDDKNKPQTIDLQALAPAPLKSRLNDLRRYL